MIFATAYDARQNLTRIAKVRRSTVAGATFTMDELGTVVYLHNSAGKVVWQGAFTCRRAQDAFVGWATR